MNDQLAFQVTKLIAESDSLAEGYAYCPIFTDEHYRIEKGDFAEEWMAETKKVKPVGWRDLAIQIIELVQNFKESNP